MPASPPMAIEWRSKGVRLRSLGFHGGQVEPPVIDFTAGLSAEYQNGMADYLSRLEPSGSR